MKILLIGDTSGNPDEGMKNVSKNLTLHLSQHMDCQAYFVTVKEIFREIEKYKDADIINFMVGPSWRTFIYGHLLRLILHKKIILVVSFIHPRWNFFARLAFWIFRPDAAIAQTQKWKDKIGKNVKNTVILPLAGVRSEIFSPIDTHTKRQFKDELGLPQDKIILLHVGHLNEGRNLRILNQFKDSSEIFPVMIASSTVIPDDKLLDSLLKNRVRVIHGFIQQIDKFYKAADCYIFPTIDKNYSIQIPLSVLEALACNLPVISSKYEALPFFFPENKPMLTYLDSFDNLSEVIVETVRETKGKSLKINPIQVNSFEWKVISENLYMFYINLIQASYEQN